MIISGVLQTIEMRWSSHTSKQRSRLQVSEMLPWQEIKVSKYAIRENIKFSLKADVDWLCSSLYHEDHNAGFPSSPLISSYNQLIEILRR